MDRSSEITDIGQHVTGGELCLLVLEETGLRRYGLPAAGTISVGRAEGVHVCLTDRLASRHHLLLHLGDTLAVEDTNSANGTRVRGEAVLPGQRVQVDVGEAIYVGSTVLTVRYAQWNRPTPPDRPARKELSSGAFKRRDHGSRSQVERLKILRALEKAHRIVR